MVEDIRTHAFGYLKDISDSSLRKFEDWLTAATWDAHLTDAEAAGLAYSIKLLIAEHTSGDRSEDSLRRALVPILQQGEWVHIESVELTKEQSVVAPAFVRELIYS